MTGLGACKATIAGVPLGWVVIGAVALRARPTLETADRQRGLRGSASRLPLPLSFTVPSTLDLPGGILVKGDAVILCGRLPLRLRPR